LNEEEYLNRLIQLNSSYYEELSDIGYSGLGGEVGDRLMQDALARIQDLKEALEELQEEQKKTGDESGETSKKFGNLNRSFTSFQELLHGKLYNYSEHMDNFVRSLFEVGDATETAKEGFIALGDVFVGSLFGAGGVNPLQNIRSEFDNLLGGMIQLDRLNFRPGATDINARLGLSGLLLGLPQVNTELSDMVVYGQDLERTYESFGGTVERVGASAHSNLGDMREGFEHVGESAEYFRQKMEDLAAEEEEQERKLNTLKSVVKDLANVYVTEMNTIASGFGEALVKQGDAWNELAKTAVHAIAAIIQALGEQAAVQAVVAFASLNFVEGFAWSAASALAFLTAGVVRALGDQITAAAQGVDFVTDGPQLLMVGDNPGGRERVTVEPTSSPNTRGPAGGPLHLQIYLDGRSIYEGVEEAIDNNVIKIRARTR
jgi:predicted nuclease with TOPRIM domain